MFFNSRAGTQISGLQIADRLPLTLETLKTSGLGKIVVKLSKDPPAPGESFVPPYILRPCHWRAPPVRYCDGLERLALSAVVLYDLPLELNKSKNDMNLTLALCFANTQQSRTWLRIFSAAGGCCSQPTVPQKRRKQRVSHAILTS